MFDRFFSHGCGDIDPAPGAAEGLRALSGLASVVILTNAPEAARQLPGDRVSLRVSALENPLPGGPFDLVASALCVHHLPGESKRDLFARVRDRLAPGGLFVLADVVVPLDPADAVAPLSDGYDHPSPVADQLRWLDEVGFAAQVVWEERDLAVITARAPG